MSNKQRILRKNDQEVNKVTRTICVVFECEWEDVMSTSRETYLVNARMAFAEILYSELCLSQVNIARLLYVSQPAVSKLLKRHQDCLKYDSNYSQKYARLKATWEYN